MTKLSIFLYLADVLDNLASIFIGLSFATVACVFIAIVVWSVNAADSVTDDDKNGSKGKELNRFFRRTYKRMVIISILSLLFAFGGQAVIPTKKTMYMIAGVELVDAFSKTETAKFLTNETKNVITDITSIIHSYAEEKTGGKTNKLTEPKDNQ